MPFAVVGRHPVAWFPTDFRPQPDDLLAFFHAQRTGGMSVRATMIDAYGSDAVMAYRIAAGYKHWSDLSDADLAGYKVYVGHAQFIERRRSRRCLPVSIVRDPDTGSSRCSGTSAARILIASGR